MVKACKHWRQKYPGLESLQAGDNQPWNAWLYYSSGYKTYEVGGFYSYLAHLKENPQCLKEIGRDPEYVNSMEKLIKDYLKSYS